MSADVVINLQTQQPAGFTQSQFRKLDQAYCLAASRRVLSHRSVECDFDDGIVSYTYYMNEYASPFLQFVIRKLGPKTTMFELYKQGKGRIVKSGLFDRPYNVLREEIETLLNEF